MPATPPLPPEADGEAEPATASAWVARARQHHGAERNTSALAAFDRALALDPAHADAWLGKALLLEDLERPDAALAAYDALLARAEGNRALQSAAWSNRAGLLARAQNFPEALASLDRALLLDPENHLLIFNKGMLLLEGFEQPAQALPWLERAHAAGLAEASEPLAACRQALEPRHACGGSLKEP
ncbi:MAG: tetratricopeptide repeat protein [Terriglobales bacterium]